MIPGVDYNQLGLYTEANIDAIDIVQLRLWASYRGQTLARTGGWFENLNLAALPVSEA